MPITAGEVEARMEEAATTLRRLPNPRGSGPRGFRSSWPEYVREAKHAYGYHEPRLRVLPSPAQIDRMDEALLWLQFLKPEDARIVWMRAERAPWKEVCIQAACVRQTAWRRWVAALHTIARTLNRQAAASAGHRPRR